jgi:hypothetical protein
MAKPQRGHDIDLLDPADRVAELKRMLVDPRSIVVIYACGCQAPIDLPDRCRIHASPIRKVIRTSICED